MGCRRRASPQDLVRLSAGSDGGLLVDAPGGRGAWLCRHDEACLARAGDRGAIERALRRRVPPDELARVGAALRATGGEGRA